MDPALGGRLGLSHLDNLAAVCSTLWGSKGGGRNGEKDCSWEGSQGAEGTEDQGLPWRGLRPLRLEEDKEVR